MKQLAVVAMLLGAVALNGCNAEGQKVQEIKFDLGKNIVETARASGVPKFEADKTAGLISYSVSSIPSEIATRFARTGYEVAVAPLYAFTLYANHSRTPDDLVFSATLQMNTIKSHDTAQAFVEQLLGQFAKGKWKRYITDSCPAVTGRSSWLDEAGQLKKGGVICPDPAYKLTREEWLVVMNMGKFYSWIGDGVIAQLQVGYGEDPPIGVNYQMFLEFELEDVQKKRNAQADADHIKEGEAKGWNTAAKAAKGKIETEAMNKLLEANAIKRGDQVVAR